MTDILIQVGGEEFRARLLSDRSPETVREIAAALPIRAVARTWGEEIYFSIPVQMAAENAQATVHKGDLGYWPDGNCFCMFYGKTPMSESEDAIIPASPVNVIGTIENPADLKKHRAGEQVVIKQAE